MKRENAVQVLLLAICMMVPTLVLCAQGKKLDAGGLQRLPDSIQRNVKALGRRALEKDKEEVVLSGTFVDGFGGPPLPVRVVQQLSGEVTLEGFKDKSSVSFDGAQVTGTIDAMDDALLESLAADTIEGLFVSLQAGASMQVLGYGFKWDADKRVSFDIYDVVAPARTRSDQPVQMKRYFFDSATGLLMITRYEAAVRGRRVHVDTRFSDWQNVEGSWYAGRVERFEDDRLMFSFQATGVRNGRKGQNNNSQQ